MKTTGTNETFSVEFLTFDYEKQKWQAECRIGEDLVVFANQSGRRKWYVIGHMEVKVPEELENHLTLLANNAVVDDGDPFSYIKAVGEIPKEIIQ